MRIVKINGKDFNFRFDYVTILKVEQMGVDVTDITKMTDMNVCFTQALRRGGADIDADGLAEMIAEDPGAFERLGEALRYDLETFSSGGEK